MKRKFMVRVVGRNLHTREEKKIVRVGFVATRCVSAESPENAEQEVLELVRRQSGTMSVPGMSLPTVAALETCEVPDEHDGIEPKDGFTFFDEE